MSQIQSGGNTLVKWNGKIIGFASDFQWSGSQGTKEIFGVDSPFPYEIAEGASPTSVKGSMTIFKLRDSSLESAAIVGYRTTDKGKSADMLPKGTGVLASNNLGSNKYSQVELVDRATQNSIAKFYFVVVDSQSWRVFSKTVMTGSITFTAILVSTNETPTNSSFF